MSPMDVVQGDWRQVLKLLLTCNEMLTTTHSDAIMSYCKQRIIYVILSYHLNLLGSEGKKYSNEWIHGRNRFYFGIHIFCTSLIHFFQHLKIVLGIRYREYVKQGISPALFRVFMKFPKNHSRDLKNTYIFCNCKPFKNTQMIKFI